MTLKTRLGNLGNILDEDESQCRLLQLDSPVLLERQVRGDARAIMGETALRGRLHLPPPTDGEAGAARRASSASAREAEEAVRGGCTHSS